jgi:hypothetical protein
MNLRKIAILVGGAALTLSLIGAGVGASFTGTVTANQQVNVGAMSVAATPVSANAHLQPDGSILCDAVLITTDSGIAAPCSFTVTSTGTIPATHYTVSQTETGLSAAQLASSPSGDPKFGTNALPFDSPTQSWGAGGTLPVNLDPMAEWGQWGTVLDPSDYGTSFWITYTVTVTP